MGGWEDLIGVTGSGVLCVQCVPPSRSMIAVVIDSNSSSWYIVVCCFCMLFLSAVCAVYYLVQHDLYFEAVRAGVLMVVERVSVLQILDTTTSCPILQQ